MLVGYVSDEDDVALCDVAVSLDGEQGRFETRSAADGAIHVDAPPGSYSITLRRDGFGAKRVTIAVGGQPLRLRLLSNRLTGFMWPKWVRAGEVAEYRVHSQEEFKLELFRYGWEKEFIRSLGWCDEHGPRAMSQITPDGDYTQSGVDWNRLGFTLQHQKHVVVAPPQSGLYYLHATTRSGEFFSFPWIVAPAAPTSRVAVLTSNMTWNAYNNFGGRSNYFSQDGLRPQPTVNARQDLLRYTSPDTWPFEERAAPLSFERPERPSCVPETTRITDSIAGRMGSAFAQGEWRLLGWLEREGFDFDLYSEMELHFGGLPLDAYKVLILNTHPEYWSPQMYQRVKRWVYEKGGRLMYLAGCGLYAEVEFAETGESHRNAPPMLCRREGEYTLRGESEANLLGVAYTHSGFQSGAPYRVLDAEHWVFEGSGMRGGDRFGRRSLHERCPGGASAHELDKLSPHSPDNIRHLAKGENADDSGADMTAFETPSGGAVFAAGSLCWTLSLAIDDGVSAITANVLRRFLR